MSEVSDEQFTCSKCLRSSVPTDIAKIWSKKNKVYIEVCDECLTEALNSSPIYKELESIFAEA